ncbi:TVP38/TMEM64 family protein [Virgibacillus sp. MSJ-26]|uniref:TVP38/TMEM64 family protein n=1 Tax=Virgibacillus sp. MSJ-26 TaxID=2841522 RepID=UPI001C0FFCEF|nr:TVP38/TMEM64 family protein [Virgibacillus sp. MSJ-26]MBU5468372.1 TVP38/TMEM64 family protein [Virgibacillus sp. MSJ-26]
MYVLNILSEWKFIIKNEQLDDYILELLSNYEKLGPIPGIALPFIEAFLPFLPLLVIIIANSAAYGLLKGFLYSWIGTSIGSVLLFMIIRRLGDKRIFIKIRKNKQVHKVTGWVEKHGFGPLFLLLCFPFSPSSVINVVAGLSRINTYQFVLATFLGKAVMVFSVAYIGASIVSFAKNPVKTILVGIGVGLFWIVGKYIERKLHKKSLEKEYQSLAEVKKDSNRV